MVISSVDNTNQGYLIYGNFSNPLSFRWIVIGLDGEESSDGYNYQSM